ncbi:MAG: M15 family metallopeptidase [Parabacteroides sp.]
MLWMWAIGFIQAQDDKSSQEWKRIQRWEAGTQVSDACIERFGMARCFVSEPISDEVFQRMKGRSYKATCPIPREELRYLKILHRDREGLNHLGELVCHQTIADDLLAIFRQLYEASYPIEHMVLIDVYEADDIRSMQANNSSAFNFRFIAGTTKLSNHSQGLAIDINPLYNPYVKRRSDGSLSVSPKEGRPYADRSRLFAYKITADDLCCRLFKAHGFTWGGDWIHQKDYQHFEKKK